MKGDHPKMEFVSKGWGWERWIVNKQEYCGKILNLAKDRKCSIHYHIKKDEVFYVLSGKVLMRYHDQADKMVELEKLGLGELSDHMDHVILDAGDNFYVPPGRIHQFFGLEDSTILEISTFHCENDSIRIVKGD